MIDVYEAAAVAEDMPGIEAVTYFSRRQGEPAFAIALAGSVSSASAVVTGLSSTAGLFVGQQVASSSISGGTEIPVGATIASIDSPSQITLAGATGIETTSGARL